MHITRNQSERESYGYLYHMQQTECEYCGRKLAVGFFLHGSPQKVLVNSTSSSLAAGSNPQNCTYQVANISNSNVKQQKKLPGTDSHCLRKPITIWL